MFSGNREELRNYYFSVWQKYQQGKPLDSLEQQILHVILEHPEYHYCFQDPENYRSKDYQAGETNPFLHMALHLAIREQVTTNRPDGITDLYQRYLQSHQGDHLSAEHAMLDILTDQLLKLQANPTEFNERDYLHQLRRQLDPSTDSAANQPWEQA